MRYYRYISDSKVDMMLPQIPGGQKKQLATKIGVDLKILNASVSSESLTLGDRVTRAEFVEKFLTEADRVGSIDSPKSYFRGSIELASTTIGPRPNDRDGAVVIYSGSTVKTHLYLAGSARNLIGANTQCTHLPYSNLSVLIEFLSDLDDISKKFEDTQDTLVTLLERATRHPSMNIPQKIWFLAKKQVIVPEHERPYLIGSPIFVATYD